MREKVTCETSERLERQASLYYTTQIEFGSPAPSAWKYAGRAEQRPALCAHFYNPKGIAPQSPGLRGTSYPGLMHTGFSTPTGLCHTPQHSSQYKAFNHARWSA